MAVYSSDREILRTALDWLAQGHRPVLVTVARTWGSSPRPVGSMLLMRADGRHAGSVSGGCVEEDLLARYREQQLGAAFPTLIDYGVDRAEAQRFGLPCGGRLELLLELLDNPAPIELLLTKLDAGQLLARRVCFSTGAVSLHPATAAEGFDYDARHLVKVFGPRWHLLLIGAGHLSRYVAAIAVMLDYRVIICDPRDDYQLCDDLIGVERLYMMPDEAVQAYACHPHSVVLALTHDPRLDDMALLDALASPAFYIGAIGSHNNSESRRERLRGLGVGAQALARLHAPVGLAIGSHSPAEIAVSILAELTALRNQRRPTVAGAVSAA